MAKQSHPAVIGSTGMPPQQHDYRRVGYLAYVRGRSLFDCPYDMNTHASREWMNGYSEARRDAKGGGK